MNVIGIDIGTVSIKCVRVKGKSLTTSIHPFSGNLDSLAAVLEEVKEREGTNLEVRVAMSSTDIIKKTFTIPFLPKEDLKGAIKWSVAKVLGESEEQYVWETGILGPVEEMGVRKQEMYFVGAKRSFIDSLLVLFEEKGFRRVSLFTDVAIVYTSIARELRHREGFSILDIGGRQTGLYIFREGRLWLVREILTAGESFTDALIVAMGLTFEGAEALKIERGFDQGLEAFFLPVLERLSGEVGRTINVYNQRYPEAPLELIYLTGRGARLKGMFERMAELLPYELRPLPTLFPIEEEFLPAYTLCMRPPGLNLLPKERREKIKEGLMARWARIGAAILFLVLLLFSIDTVSQIKALDLKIKLEKAALEKKKAMVPREAKDPKELASREELLREAGKKDGTFPLFLKYLSSSLPQGLYLKEISFEQEKGKESFLFEIKGIAIGEKETLDAYIVKFLLSLERDAFFKEAQLSGTEWKEIAGRRVMEFTLRGTCEGVFEG